jgi:hypothetical protein
MHERERAVARLMLAARASWAVASSPPMQRYPEYVDRVRASERNAQRWNPHPRVLFGQIVDAVRVTTTPEALLELPWATRVPEVGRAYAAYVSFVDDYRGLYPGELFPVPETRQVLDAIAAASERGEVWTVPEQLGAALPIAGGRVYAAVVLLHAATRMLARGRDGRALGPAVAALTLEDRLRIGAAIAPWPAEIARGGDAMGDTYHYWASFAAGMHTTLGRGSVARHVVRGAFALGPVLMSTIRGGLFARPLFCGNHAELDRLGLAQGTALARLLRGAQSGSVGDFQVPDAA